MADNPFQGMLNPNMNRGASMWDLRMMAAANRSELPFERMAGRGYGHQGISGNPMLAGLMGASGEPDYSQFTYDPVMRQRAIDAGIQPLEASQVKQNVVLPNSGFFGRHQRLSNAIEGGLFGALAAHGGTTPGDTIQGTLEGIVGGQRLRQGMQREQFARPFEAASMLEGIADRKQTRELHEMEIQHLRAENQKLGRPDHDFRAFGVSRNDPDIATIDNTTGKVTFEKNPLYDPSTPRTPEDLTVQTRENLRAQGIDPGSATPQQIAAAQKKAQEARDKPPHALVAVPDGKGGVTYEEATPGKHFANTPETPAQAGGEKGKIAAHRQAWIQTQLGKPGPIWMAAGVSPGDKQAAQKLGQFYDENFPSGGSEGPTAGTQENPHVIQ